MRRSSTQNSLLLAIFVAVVLLITGALAFAVADNAGVPKQQNLGQITDVRYSPSYTSGAGDHRTHHSAYWKLSVQTPAGKDSIRRSWMPPGWMHEGAYVQVTYHLGRFSRNVSIDKLEEIG